jgi:hypothetical protein
MDSFLGVRSLRSLAVIAATALVLVVADYVVSSVTVFALVSGSLPALVIGVLLAACVLTIVLVAVSRVISGRLHVAGAVLVTLTLAVAGGYGFATGNLAPVGTQQNVSLHLLVCALAAGVFGLFLGPWPIRIGGGLAAAALVASLVLMPTAQERAATQYADEQHQAVLEQRDYFRQEGTSPVVTDLEHWSNARLRATGSDAMTWMISDDGAIADVLVTGHVDEATMDPDAPCTWVQRQGDYDIPAPGALPSWCVKTETGWARTDGTGISFVRDGTLIGLNTSDEYDIVRLGGTRAATPEEIAALAASLRPMTEAELEKWVLPTYAGLESPEVATDGL